MLDARCQTQGSRTPGISYQSQGRTPNPSAHCIWYWSCQGKQHSQALDRTMLYAHKEETARSASVVCDGPL